MSGRGGELGRAAGRARSACTVRLHVGPRWLAGRARRPAPTRKRPAAFSATCLPGPSVAPMLLSLLFLPPPREREGGVGDGTAPRVFSARASPHLGRSAAALHSGADLPAPCGAQRLRGALPPLHHPRSAWTWGGDAGKRPRLWGSLALATPPAGWPPSPVKPKLCGLGLRRERNTRSRTLTPQTQPHGGRRKTPGAGSVRTDCLLASPAVDSKLINMKPTPRMFPTLGWKYGG